MYSYMYMHVCTRKNLYRYRYIQIHMEKTTCPSVEQTHSVVFRYTNKRIHFCRNRHAGMDLWMASAAFLTVLRTSGFGAKVDLQLAAARAALQTLSGGEEIQTDRPGSCEASFRLGLRTVSTVRS